MMGKGRLRVIGLCGLGESHAPDAFATVLNPTTDTHLSATRIHNDGIMQGAALPSTPPVWVATHGICMCFSSGRSFYPRHPCGWRHHASIVLSVTPKFLSTPPVWVATAHHPVAFFKAMMFLSTPPVWVATSGHRWQSAHLWVSIHATRVGGDKRSVATKPIPAQFLSTPPVWVATATQKPLTA